MTIVVAGGTGFMGGAIARHLLSAGMTVRILTRSADKACSTVSRWPEGPTALREGRVTFAAGDVTEPAYLPPAVKGAELVIQAAQFPGAPVEDPRKGHTYLNVDRGGTINLLEAMKQAEAAAGHESAPRPHFIYLSGVGVTGDSTFPWVRAKLEAEQAVQASPFPWTIVRSSWAYGPRDRSLNRLLGYARRLPFLPFFGNGRERVTPIFVEDVGRLFAELAAAPGRAAGLVLPLGGPNQVTLNEMLQMALSTAGMRRPIVHVPLTVGRAMGAVAQYLPGRPLTPGAVDFVAHGGVADPEPLRHVLPGFAPTSLRDGLAAYLSRGGGTRF